jgi:hypothetical protein
MATSPAIQRRSRDRRLYIGSAILIPLIVLVGFAPTYYLKPWFQRPALPSLLVHLHGAVMTSWVVLFVAQISLVATRRTKIHQRLGILGAVLAGLVCVVGVATAIAAAARDSVNGVEPLRFLVVPFGDLLVFAILIVTALYFRRRMDVHKRLMLLAAVALLPPAFARFPLPSGSPLEVFGLVDLFLLGCIAWDTYKLRRLHPVFLWGSLFLVASQPLRFMLGNTDAWLRFATWVTS